MKLQRYDTTDCSDEWNVTRCEDGEYVKADEALAEIARLNAICGDKSSEIFKLRGENMALQKNLNEVRDIRFELMTEIVRLRAALEHCHQSHFQPKVCAEMVDKYYHELFLLKSIIHTQRGRHDHNNESMP
jgi:hypothetical protein